MLEFYTKNKNNIHTAFYIVLTALCFYLFFEYLFSFVAPFVLGWFLSLLFYPFANLLFKKWHIPLWIGSVLSIVFFLGFIFLVLAGIVSKLSSEASLFYQSLPGYLVQLEESLAAMTGKIDETVSLLPPVIQNFLNNENGFSALNLTASLLKNSSTSSFTAVMAIPNSLMVLVVGLISSYFFTKDKKEIASFITHYLPETWVESFRLVKKDLIGSIAGYFKTQLILMIFTFTICLIGLFILKSPYALLLSVITSLIDTIPFFGSGFILWPGALLFLFMGETFLAVGYCIIYLVINLMRQIMQPKILGAQIGLSPLITLASMYIGLKCLGIFGMILGPIIAVVLKAILTIRAEKAEQLALLKNTLHK